MHPSTKRVHSLFATSCEGSAPVVGHDPPNPKLFARPSKIIKVAAEATETIESRNPTADANFLRAYYGKLFSDHGSGRAVILNNRGPPLPTRAIDEEGPASQRIKNVTAEEFKDLYTDPNNWVLEYEKHYKNKSTPIRFKNNKVLLGNHGPVSIDFDEDNSRLRDGVMGFRVQN